MATVYVGNTLRPVEIKKSLSEERYEKAMKKKYKTKYSREDTDSSSSISEAESLVIPPEMDGEDIGDTDEERSEEKYFGKDVVVSPLAYYTVNDSLKHALNDYKDKIKKTTNIVMEKRSKYGQRAATPVDKNDVLGEFPEKNATEVVVPDDQKTGGGGLKLKRHYFTRPINNILYRITIDEHPVGIGQSRRNTYMLVDIAVIFYKKNGIGLGKEIVLRSKVLRMRKRAPRQ
jgi:hypothetical protein